MGLGVTSMNCVRLVGQCTVGCGLGGQCWFGHVLGGQCGDGCGLGSGWVDQV